MGLTVGVHGKAACDHFLPSFINFGFSVKYARNYIERNATIKCDAYASKRFLFRSGSPIRLFQFVDPVWG